MRRLMLTLSTVFMLCFLAGCSLPIGDGLLTISSEGVDFIKGENNEKDLAEDDEDGAIPAVTETEDSADDVDKEQDNEANDSQSGEMNDANGDAEANEDKQTSSSHNNCEKQDHSRVLQQIGNDFYIPDCAVITSQTFSENDVTIYLDLPDADWEEVADDYRAKLPRDGFSDSTNFESQQALIYFKQYGDDSDSSHITIQQADKGEVGEEDYQKNVHLQAIIRK